MADDPLLGADDVARKHFATAFRGFDQYEVRAFLAQVAATLASLHEREKALRDRIESSERAQPAPAVDGDLETQLGAETARVLHAAREAAAEIRARAEESVARMLREANDEAARVRSEAETVLAARLEEAEVAAAAVIDEATTRGREMVAEAQAVRERMLKDVARKRKVAAIQVEQLLTARRRLVDAYELVRANVDEVTRELEQAERDVELAAELVAPDTEPLPEPVPESKPEAAPVVSLVPEPQDVAVAPDPQPEPPIEPEPEPPIELEDRRSSSLRLLRRRPEPDAVELDEDVEGVRLLQPETVPAPRPAVTVAPEPAPEPEVAHAPVEDLFARLRADRAAAVAQAEAVLAEAPAPEPEPEPEPEPQPEPAPAPVTAVGDAFEVRDAALEDAERSLTRAVKRILADEQNEVLDTLRRHRGRPALDDLVPAPAVHAARYVEASTAHLWSAAASGASAHDGEAPAVEAVASALAEDVTTDIRARLARAVDADGSDREALVESVSAAYREWKTARAEPLARHHLAAAYALGLYDAAPGDRLRWVVDPAEGGCPDCDDNALAGPTPKGEAFPTGQPHPPAHVGCRCLVLPAS